MGFSGVITNITNGAVSQAVTWIGDFQTPLMIIVGLGIFLIAAGALVSWVNR